MDNLGENAKTLLERAKPQFLPSEAQRERLWTRLETTPIVPPVSGTRRWLRVIGTTVAAGVVAAALWGAFEDEPTHPRFAVGVVPSVPLPRPLVHPRPPLLTPSDFPPLDRAPPKTSSAGTNPHRAARAVPPRAPKHRHTPRADTFAAQLELIAAARRDLDAGRLDRARRSASLYLRRFPRGVFVEEARVIDLLAACGTQPTESTRERAEAYLRRGKASFGSRVRQTCLSPIHQ